MRTQREFVEVDRLWTRVFRHDDRACESDPTIVLIHGAGGNYLLWPPQIRRLPGALTLAVDLPGHGKSEGAGYDRIDAYAAFVIEFIVTLGLCRPVLVGHSMGAAIALEIARLQPGTIAALGLLACGDRFDIPDEWDRQIEDDWVSAVGRIAAVTLGVNKVSDKLSDKDLLAMQRLAEADPEVVRRDYAACRAYHASNHSVDIECPSTIVVGGEDQLVPVSSSRGLHEMLADSELRVLDSAEHMFLWDRTDEMVQALSVLLDRIQRR